MTERRPIVLIDGDLKELPTEDSIPGSTVSHSIIEVTGNRILTESDLSGNVIIEADSDNPITLMIPDGLTNKEPLRIIQVGSGEVRVFAYQSLATVLSLDDYQAIKGQHGYMMLIPSASNTYRLIGDLGTTNPPVGYGLYYGNDYL